MKYRHKPTEVEARQFAGTKTSALELMIWLGECDAENQTLEWTYLSDANDDNEVGLDLSVRGGIHLLNKSDWLVRNGANEFYPCPDAIFAESYDALPA